MNFQSFFMAGFECATGFNSRHEWIDQIAATQHGRFLDDDYALCASGGLRTIREGVRWPLVDSGRDYDTATIERVIESANDHRLELILDLFHYGYPQGLDVFGPEFVERFEAYCEAVARVVERHADVPVHFTPVNEPSYFSWAAGEAARFAPYETGRAYEMKVNLCRAAIRGIEAIWSILPEARIVNVDPLCRVAAPRDSAEDRGREVDFFNQVAVFECWDMLAGRLHPELGGSPKHLDTIGLNYYWTNQWQIGNPDQPLDMDDERLTPVRELVQDVWQRYRRPMIISETSHVEHMRGPWLRYMVEEIAAVRAIGLPLNGICLYPILGMPEWHEPEVWVRMGLWDLIPDRRGRLLRVPDRDMVNEYQAAVKRYREIEAAREVVRRRR